MIVFRYSVPLSWYEGVYQDKNAPCKAGRPFTLAHKEKTDKAVLLIHGYAGYPGEMVRPARDLYERGFDVYAPRLPGCGTTGEDFGRSTGKDWLGLVLNAARDLRARYKTLYVLGHSLGTALVILASQSVRFDRIVLAAPAVAEKAPSIMIRIASVFKKKMPKPWQSDPSYVLYYEDAPADDAYLGKEYWSWNYTRQSYELLRLMYEAGKAAKSLAVPTLIIVGGEDLVVGPEPANILDRTIPAEHKTIKISECTHFPFYDKDKDGEEKAVQAVLEWFS